jgi:drug/metabolite transporter (DMT)-like permease
MEDGWIMLGLIGPSTVLALGGFFLAMQGLGSARASIVSNVEPAGAVLLGWLALGQLPTPVQGLGIALVIGSAMWLGRDASSAS